LLKNLVLRSKEEYNALKKDIEERGIQDPLHVVKLDGVKTIISGHQRAKIARELGIKVPCIIRDDLKEDWQIEEQLIADNLLRRQLTDAQKAKAGLKLEEIEKRKAKMRQIEGAKIGGMTAGRGRPKDENSLVENFPPPKTDNKKGKTRDRVAEKVGFGSGKQYEKAKKVLLEAPEEIKKKWEKGEITTHKAENELRKYKKKKEIENRLIEPEPLEEITREKKYDIIYADPPWKYEFSQTKNREIENQYPTMDLEEICKLQIPAADDAVLFLWCPMPKLDWGLKVIEAWGFKYRTGFVWVKDKIGMGHYVRSKHELLLIGIKGTPGTPLPANRPESVVFAPRSKHSKKPDVVYEIIEKMYPEKSYFEMFARETREGWEVWGNEV